MDLSFWAMALRVITGAVIGFLIGLTGIGGGVLVMPALTVILGLAPTTAVGTASLYAFLTKIMAAVKHISLKNVDFRTCGSLLLGALPANLAVAVAINMYRSANAGNRAIMVRFETTLNILIAAVIVMSAIILIINLRQNQDQHGEEALSPVARWARRSLGKMLLAGVISGSIVGALIGSTSVGGGVVLIPILITIFALSPNRTVGSSIIIGVVLTLVTAIVFHKGGAMDTPTAFLMAAGSLLGVIPGSRLAATLPRQTMKKIMVVMVLAAGALMLAGKVNGH
jgi:hypothetical protein